MRRLTLWDVLGLFSVGFLLGVSSCSVVPLDHSASADESNDPTVQLVGCGKTPHEGYLFCRIPEGTPQTERVTLVVPDVKCDRPSCVEYQWLRLDGSLGATGGFIKGQTQMDFQLAQITGSDLAVARSHDGEYRVLLKVYFKGADGMEHLTPAFGFFRLNVMKPGYAPVGCNDPARAWKVDYSKTCTFEYTSQLREAVCGAC